MMMEVLTETILEIVSALLIMLIGVLGTYLSLQLAKRQKLSAINAAQQETVALAQQTVAELKQTVVDGLKSARSDGKLTKEEITSLKKLLLERTKAKMSATTQDLLNAAGVDITALIRGAGESLIASMKQSQSLD